MSPRRSYVYAVGAAVLVGALLIGLSLVSTHRGEKAAAPQSSVTGIGETAALLEGIPQRGNALGSASAPVRLVEYADLQCPYCAAYARDVLPTLVRDYVRTGKVELVFRGLAFLGPGSDSALRTATAAGNENRMWNVLELAYRNQGPENAWVTDELLRAIVTGAGADAPRVFAERDGAAVSAAVNESANSATTAGVSGVPAFFLGRRGDPLARLSVSALSVPEFRTPLDRALQGE